MTIKEATLWQLLDNFQKVQIAVREVMGNKVVPNVGDMPREILDDYKDRPMAGSSEKRVYDPGNSCFGAVR